MPALPHPTGSAGPSTAAFRPFLGLAAWAAAFALAPVLAGCHPGHHHAPAAAALTIDVDIDEDDPVEIDGVGETVTVSRAGVYDLAVDGSGNTVRIADGQRIGTLSLDGIDNQVRVGAGCSIGAIVIDGIDGELLLPLGSTFSISDSGISTEIAYYTSG